MPEGPSIIILKEAVNALQLEGQEITGVSGNTRIDKAQLLHRKVTAFRSWGKHFLVCFERATLRIHLLLFGSYRINERKEASVRLSLRFQNAELNFYNCSLVLLDQPADEVYDWSRDIMSDEWDPDQAFVKLREVPNMLVCDALLHQDFFAGSGNIIKNEVLFRIRLHPSNTIGKVPADRLREMITATRNYSFDFLTWKKEFSLREHWQVYNKGSCPRCHIPLTRATLGKFKRRSFFCNNCQELFDS